MAALTFFGVTGTFSAALKDSVYDVDTDPELAPMSGTVTFTPLIDSGNSVPAVTLTPASNLFLVPIKAAIRSGVITSNGATGVKLVANTAVLGLTGNLYYRVDFGDGLTAGGKTYAVRPFTFQAPTTATTVDLVEVTPTTGQPATGPVPSSAVLSVAGRTGNIVITAADISGVESTTNKGAANGYAGLDSNSKIALAAMPVGAMEYKGVWNASTNTPTLTDGTGTSGFLYRVGTAASRNLGSGSVTWDVGDYVIHNGTTWEKSDSTDVTWGSIPSQPAVIAAGANAAAARAAIGAVATTDFAVSVKSFGVMGDGSTNDTAAIATAMAAGVPLRVPTGTYLTTAPIVQRDVSVIFDPGVTIKATSSMAALWQVGTASITVANKCLHGAGTVFECNDLASVGLSIYAFQHFEASSITVSQPALHGIVVGDPGATFVPSFEAIIDQVHTIRRAPFNAGSSALTPPTGGRGLWIRAATDGEYSRMDLVGNETGVRADTDNNRFAQIHPWGYEGYLPATSFDDHGNHNKWIGCGADSPSNQGWSINGVGAALVGCNLYVNEFVTDDTVVGVKVESANANLTVVGMSMLGKDGSHRVHQDFGGAHGVDSATIIGHSNVNVVNQNVYQVSSLFGAKARFNSDVKFAETGTPVLVTDGADTAFFSVNTSTDATYGKQIAVVNGADLAGWSDNYSTQKWKLKGLTGVLLLGRYATGSLPSASTAGAGAQAFDTTKKIPVWSDGTAWHDGLGPTPTLTSPRIGTAIQDSAGNSILILSPSASAVNYIGMTNAPATGTPSFYAGGSDTNVGLDIWTQGTGRVRINGNPAGVKVGVPASASAAGAPGDWAADSSWHYDCIAANTWVRSAAATW